MPAMTDAKPNINVTPFIDILLVLLIIFMAISPLKPASFKAKIPAQPKDEIAITNTDALIVTVDSDSSLALNDEKNLGSIAEPQKLSARLSAIFQMRLENGVYADGAESRNDLPESEKIQKTVFIKAPRGTPYGEIVKVIDAAKIAGASPIALQIDGLR